MNDYIKHPANGRGRITTSKLRVMKFGGTSVADAVCIRKVLEIIRGASGESGLVVVVSAMNGVTNQLIDAAIHSEAENYKAVEAILECLRNQHENAIEALIQCPTLRDHLRQKMRHLLQEAARFCEGTRLIRELTLRANDSISSIGERLSAPLVAAALAERGVPSEAVEATELVITDSCHGRAEPRMDLTTERCRVRLGTLLQQGCVPVVTGFIGATADGVLTTLGRGGSDYSATILGAALGADEVIIWKEVDGLLTADPRLVPGATIIPEISYREASELACFGAKVLHPKTLHAVMQCGIPLWIRNTFAPDRPGTKITLAGSSNGGRTKALTAIHDAALITVSCPGIPRVLERTLATSTAVKAEILLVSQSSQNNISLVVPSSMAKRTADALRSEFDLNLTGGETEHIVIEPEVAIVTVVAQNIRQMSGIVGRIFSALEREHVSIMAIAQGSSECSICFLVPQKELQLALIIAHREFQVSGDGAPLHGLTAEFPNAAPSAGSSTVPSLSFTSTSAA